MQMVQARENGGGSSAASGLFPRQPVGGGYERPMLQENQIKLSLPSNASNWQASTNQSNVSMPVNPTNWQGPTHGTENPAAMTQLATAAIVTSTSNFTVDRQAEAATAMPISAPLSAGFEPTLSQTSVAFPPNVSQATPSIFSNITTNQQLQQPDILDQSLQTIFKQTTRQAQVVQAAMPEWQQQLLLLQQQAEELKQRQQQVLQKEAQVKAQEEMLQQKAQEIVTELRGQQSQQPTIPYQQQQGQSIQQADNGEALKEKRMKHIVLSALLEREAKKMNPGFKLPSNQMFLMLGNQITIADRSLVDIAFSAADTTNASQSVDLQLQTLANQSTASLLGGATIYSQPVQSAKLVSQSASTALQYGSPTVTAPPQFGSTNQAIAYQAPPLAQQLGLPQLQNMSAQQPGHNNPYNSPANIRFQQFPTGTPQFQLGTSAGAGDQQHSALGQGTRNPQSSGQSGKSIFPRNNLPFSAANLDDDDVEIDSEGPKRKKPIQLYGKTAKKQANGSNMKNGFHMNNGSSINNGSNMNSILNGLNMGNGLPRHEEPVVIDLTVDNKNKNYNLNTDLNDNDLETDCFEVNMNKLNENGGTVKDDMQMDRLSKIENSKKLSGLHVGGKVKVENDLNEEVGHAEDSGVFSMGKQDV